MRFTGVFAARVVFLLALLLLFVSAKRSLLFAQPTTQSNSAAVLDFSQTDFDSGKTVFLDGIWEFYWQKLYTPDDFDANRVQNPMLVPVKGNWRNYELNGEKLPPFGYATYRIRLLFSPKDKNKQFGIGMNSIASSFRFYVNGVLTDSAGIVAKSEAAYLPSMYNGVLFFQLPDTLSHNKLSVDLIFQVANYKQSRPGIFNSLQMGHSDVVARKHHKKISLQALSAGIILLIFITQFTLYLMSYKNRSYLYFSILALITFIRSITTSKQLHLFWPDYNYEFISSLEYASGYLIVPALALLLYDVFKKLFPTTFLLFIAGFGLVVGIFIFVTPVFVFQQYKIIYDIFVFTSGFYLTFIFLLPKVFKNEDKALVSFIALLVMYLTGINDVLYSMRIIETGLMASYGLVVFIIIQSYDTNKNFVRTLLENKTLNEKMADQNRNLELIVADRVEEINNQKEELRAQSEKQFQTNKQMKEMQDELMQQAEEVASNLEELHHAKEALEREREYTMGSIRYALTIQRAILPRKHRLDRRFESFLIYKPKDIVAGDFYWFTEIPADRTQNPTYLVAVADCTGHGVPGAFMSMIGSRFLGELVNEKFIYETDRILTEVDERIQKYLNQKENDNHDGLDVILCKVEELDNNRRRIVYTGAKRPLIIRRRSQEYVESYKGDRKAIGGFLFKERSEPFTQNEIMAEKGDMLYLTTDGYIDQNSIDRKRFGTPRMLELLDLLYDLPVAVQQKVLEYTFLEHQDKEEQRDDVTIWGIKLS